MNKLLKIFLAGLLCVLVMFTAISSAFAATVFTENGFTIRIDDDGYTRLSDWDGEGEMVIPPVVMNHYINEVDNYAFLNRTDVTGLNMESVQTLRTIGMYAFAGSGLSGNLVIPNRVTTICNSAFQETQISSAELYSGAKVIPEQMCYNCPQLSEVTINYGFRSIGRLAFAKCLNLHKVTINWTVTEIDSTAFYNCPDLVIYCYEDSFAQQYAADKHIPYALIDGLKLGDVNGDGVVDILDATEIQKYAAESTDFTDEQFELGDINKDGYCDVIDALLVQKSVIGAYELPQNIIRY